MAEGTFTFRCVLCKERATRTEAQVRALGDDPITTGLPPTHDRKADGSFCGGLLILEEVAVKDAVLGQTEPVEPKPQWPLDEGSKAGIARIFAAAEEVEQAIGGWTSKFDARPTGTSIHIKFDQRVDDVAGFVPRFVALLEQAPALLNDVCERLLKADEERQRLVTEIDRLRGHACSRTCVGEGAHAEATGPWGAPVFSGDDAALAELRAHIEESGHEVATSLELGPYCATCASKGC